MKYVLAYSWDGIGIDVFYGDTETKCIVELTSALFELSVGRTGVNNERELDRLAKTIKEHAERGEIDEALQALDYWIEKYSIGAETFVYTLREIPGEPNHWIGK